MLKWDKIEQMFVILQEERKMTANEIKLIDLIRNHPNPSAALDTAVRIIVESITQTQCEQEFLPVSQEELS